MMESKWSIFQPKSIIKNLYKNDHVPYLLDLMLT